MIDIRYELDVRIADIKRTIKKSRCSHNYYAIGYSSYTQDFKYAMVCECMKCHKLEVFYSNFDTIKVGEKV